MTWLDRANDSFRRSFSPTALVLLAMLLLAFYANWQAGVKLSKICELVGRSSNGTAQTPAEREIAEICAGRAP